MVDLFLVQTTNPSKTMFLTLGGGGGRRMTPIHLSFCGVAVSQSLRIADLKEFYDIVLDFIDFIDTDTQS